jgi:hypothetical protein
MIFNRQRVKKYSMIILAAGFALSAIILPGQCNGASAETALQKMPFPRPASHEGNWIEYHGAQAALNISGGAESCLTCHGRNDCISCHNTRPPRDHTHTWRTLSHGFMAEGNRERCFTCHKQDFCVRCHNETTPRSHRGDWLARHCTECHFSGSLPGDGCGVCHKKPPHVP